jgi:DNA polymerase
MNYKEETMTMLFNEVCALQRSPLYRFRVKNNYAPVIGDGDLNSPILFVGEAPGKKEAETGKPFCGASGKVLDALFVSAGITRGSVYIANLVKDRPPANRQPTQKEIALYGPFLKKQIDIIRPRVIVPLGRHSMKYVFTEFGLSSKVRPISEIRGTHFKAQASYGEITVVALYHPAVALYTRSNLPAMKRDMKKIARYVKK